MLTPTRNLYFESRAANSSSIIVPLVWRPFDTTAPLGQYRSSSSTAFLKKSTPIIAGSPPCHPIV